MREYIRTLGKSLGGQSIIAMTTAAVLALGYIKLLQALIDYLVMPVIGAFTPGGNWRTWEWQAGSVHFEIGQLLSHILLSGLLLWSVAGYVAFIRAGEDNSSTGT